MGMGKDILVIRTDILFKEGMFEGFRPISEKDYMPLLVSLGEYQKRTPELEEDSHLQQPIPYVWIVNSREQKIFLYKRATTGNEGRLYNRYSGGVGGHVDRDTEEGAENPLLQAMMRELKEEVMMKEYPLPKVIGFVSLRGGVEDVHFGIVALADTLEDVKPIEDMAHGQFYSIEEVEKVFADSNNQVERWTLAVFPFIKQYLQSST
ncbi:MAG: NUDIX domain-containing protein [Nanoarchaeota archaeon]